MKLKLDFYFILYIFCILGMLTIAALLVIGLHQYMEEMKFWERSDMERAALNESITAAERETGLNFTPSKPRPSLLFHVWNIMLLCYGALTFATMSISFLFICLIRNGGSSKRILYYHQKFTRLFLYFIWIPFFILLIAMELRRMLA